MNRITPQDWISILKTAEARKKKTHPTFFTNLSESPQEQIDPFSRFSLAQFVELSLLKLKEIREEYLKNEIDETTYIALSNDIADYTFKLIAAQEEERNHSLRQWLRKAALALSALFSLVLIGIPFFLKLRREEKNFEAEIDQFRQAVVQACKANSHARLLRQLTHIPSMLEKIKAHYTDHRREELINTQMREDWLEYQRIPVESRPSCDEEFEKDIKRGASFRRIDKALNIEDKERIPPLHLDAHQRVQKAVAFLKELIKTPEDRRWEQILQLSVTHACLTTTFKAILSAFNIDETSIQWEENGKYYSIKSVFSDEFPPVILGIMRHPKTKTIEKVLVAIKGSLDIVSYNTAGNELPRMIVPNAITEELKYLITFGEDHLPLISNLHSHIESHISIQEKKH